MMRRIVISGLCIFVILLMSQLVTAQTDSPDDTIKDLAAQINLWRLSLGLGPLVYNPTLERMAASQADYLAGLTNIPQGGEIHIGASGDDPRRRSQFPQFAWPTYGHPERMSVSEIAGIGSVRSSVQYWQGSPVHTRATTNPAYREMGIAARKVGRDILYIVVMGGRPNILPAMADVDVNLLYLTTEGISWHGDWFENPVRYRLLDTNEQPIQDWQPWQVVVTLPTIESDTFIVEYEAANGERVKTVVPLHPVWSSSEKPAPTSVPTQVLPTFTVPAPTVVAAFPTNTPVPMVAAFPSNTPRPGAFPSNTPIPTLAPSATPTSRPSASVRLVYYPNVFTVVPLGDRANLIGVSFRSGSMQFNADAWESITSGLNVGALLSGNCLQIWRSGNGDYAAPPECRYVRSIVYLQPAKLFWTTGSFDVLRDGAVVATCASDAVTCEF